MDGYRLTDSDMNTSWQTWAQLGEQDHQRTDTDTGTGKHAQRGGQCSSLENDHSREPGVAAGTNQERRRHGRCMGQWPTKFGRQLAGRRGNRCQGR